MPKRSLCIDFTAFRLQVVKHTWCKTWCKTCCKTCTMQLLTWFYSITSITHCLDCFGADWNFLIHFCPNRDFGTVPLCRFFRFWFYGFLRKHSVKRWEFKRWKSWRTLMTDSSFLPIDRDWLMRHSRLWKHLGIFSRSALLPRSQILFRCPLCSKQKPPRGVAAI